MKNVKIRIGNLKFEKACYLGKEPNFPSYHISVIEPNNFYYEFKKGYFKQDAEEPDFYIYVGPDEERKKSACKYEKSCFNDKESSWTLAGFNYDKKENLYKFEFFRWNVFIEEKYAKLRKDFWNILKAISDSEVFREENLIPNDV